MLTTGMCGSNSSAGNGSGNGVSRGTGGALGDSEHNMGRVDSLDMLCNLDVVKYAGPDAPDGPDGAGSGLRFGWAYTTHIPKRTHSRTHADGLHDPHTFTHARTGLHDPYT